MSKPIESSPIKVLVSLACDCCGRPCAPDQMLCAKCRLGRAPTEPPPPERMPEGDADAVVAILLADDFAVAS